MLSYFRINDPYRLIAVFAFLLVVRVVFISINESAAISNDLFPLSSIDSSNVSLFQAPLFKVVNHLLYSLFGASFWASSLIATFVIFFQAYLVNSLILTHHSLTENTYIPGFIYALTLSLSPQFGFLSGQLLAVTFLILALRNVVTHLHYRGTEENIFGTGFYIAIAALLYKPVIVFILCIYLVYMFYSGTITRRYYLMGFGFLFPFIVCWLVFFWLDQGGTFIQNYFGSWEIGTSETIPSINEMLLVLSFPFLVLLMGVIKNISGVGLTNHQIKTERVTAILIPFTALSLLFTGTISFLSFVFLLPSLTYFGTKLLLSVQRKWLAELYTLFALIWAIGSYYFEIILP